jgi:hypothetical protein
MRRRTVSPPYVAVLFLLAMCSLSVDSTLMRLSAADEPKPAAPNDKVNPPDNPAPGGAAPGRVIGNESRARARMTALALWCGILVVGVALLMIVVVWGRSVRTLARRKPVVSTVPDPLWYLKTKPAAPAGSAPIDPSRSPESGDSGSETSGRTPL